jgi:hypothetical protein
MKWTRASEAQYDRLCRGRFQLCRDLPDEPPSEDAISGTRIHKWLALRGTTDVPDLDLDELETAERCLTLEQKFLAWWNPEGAPREILREKALTLYIHKDTSTVETTGTPDECWIIGQRGAILDRKTGRMAVEWTPKNLQFRRYVVLLAANYGLTEVTVAKIQPWQKAEPPVEYTLGDILQAHEEMIADVLASHDPQAKRTPGAEQCKFCRGKKLCPEFLNSAFNDLPALAVEVPSKAVFDLALKDLPGDRLGQLFGMTKLLLESADSEIRARLKAGNPVNGWVLKPGHDIEKIIKPQELFGRWCKLTNGLLNELQQVQYFHDAVNITKKAFRTAVAGAMGFKGKELDGEVKKLLEGLTESKPTAERLESQ